MTYSNYRAFVALIAVCSIAAGCSDDSTSTTETKVCDADACESGVCLPGGDCALLVQKGGACDSTTVCADNLPCTDGFCGGKASTGDPDDDNPEDIGSEAGSDDPCAKLHCTDRQLCITDSCVDITMLGAGDPCDISNVTERCNDGLQCFKNVCMTQQDIDNAGFCTTDDDCTGQPVYKTCLSNGRCGIYSQLGYPCNETHRWCAEGLVCDDGDTCVSIVHEDEACSDMDSILCDSSEGLSCINGYCRQYTDKQPKGSECNDWTICAFGLTCREGVCSEIRNENDTCNESDNIFCGANMICQNGICAPLGQECTTSADCTEKDMFCCKSVEECGVLNRCITYDDTITHDEMCLFRTKPGIFEAQIQCRWQPPSDQTPASKSVEMPPLVGHFGNKGDRLKNVIAVYSYSPTIIRFIDPETCDTLESITVSLASRWYNYPTSADLDGDGLLEFISVTSANLYVYKWDDTSEKHKLWITVPADFRATPMIFDIDSDGIPEIVGPLGHVAKIYPDGTYSLLYNQDLYVDTYTSSGYTHEAGNDAALGYLLPDEFPGAAQIITGTGFYTWDLVNNTWKKLLDFPNTKVTSWVRQFPAYADFGTPGATAADFDFKHLDGKPEIVISGKGRAMLFAITKDASGNFDKQKLMEVNGFGYGGPVTIGDFNNDGLPEIGIAATGLFGVYDPKCTGYEAGKCADKYVLWERWSQDNSSGTTGSSLFDFDGDGQAEAVYADECFTRVYDGKTGAVLFSAKRSSSTSIEAPVIADVDGDGSAEIIMGSDGNQNCANDSGAKYAYNNASNDAVDPIHEGIRCLDDEDCPKGVGCRREDGKAYGLCTCQTDDDCNTQYAPGKTTYLKQYICKNPIHPEVGMRINADGKGRKQVIGFGTPPVGYNNDYKVCRATRKTADIGMADFMIFKDRLDRWVSSRTVWNQHAYNIINIEDNGKVPTPAQWLKKWSSTNPKLTIDGTDEPRPLYNNYRLNEQGLYGAGRVPDITGRFEEGTVCGQTAEGKHVISGKLCNRGTKPVSTKLPASFFYYDETKEDHLGERLCTSLTDYIVGVGECSKVGCEISEEELAALAGKRVVMVTNRDEHGSQSTVECNYDNNNDTILITECAKDPIVIY